MPRGPNRRSKRPSGRPTTTPRAAPSSSTAARFADSTRPDSSSTSNGTGTISRADKINLTIAAVVTQLETDKQRYADLVKQYNLTLGES